MRTTSRLARVALAAVCVAAAACSGDSTAPAAAPMAPSSLAATPSMTQITLTWLLPPGSVDQVQIQRSVGGAPYAALTTLKPATGTYTDTGLTAGVVYGYQVQACNAGGCSTAAQISVTTPTTVNTTPLSISTPALPPSLVNLAYEPQLRTTGGTSTASPTWALVSGTLPSGVTMDASGSFSGKPTQTGSFPITVKVTKGSETAQKALTIQIIQPDLTRWNITRMDVQPVDAAYEPAVSAAIARWESIITKDLVMDTIPRGFYSQPGQDTCDGFGPAAEGVFIDDFFLMVNIGTLPQNVIAEATSCGWRVADQTSVIGILTLSRSYLATLPTDQLNAVVFHEIGHTLGYGVFWDFARFPDTGFRTDFITPNTCVFDTTSGNLTVGADPRFTGPAAVREWQALGRTGAVPIEDNEPYGPGTLCSHWRESVFDSEVMTGIIENTGTKMPLSRVTIASMADLGFTVDYSKADPYQLPAQPASLQATSPWTIGGDYWLPLHWEIVQPERARPLTGRGLNLQR